MNHLNRIMKQMVKLHKHFFSFSLTEEGFANRLACFSMTEILRLTAIYLFSKICSRNVVFTAIYGNILQDLQL
jgi:hypothetical protein